MKVSFQAFGHVIYWTEEDCGIQWQVVNMPNSRSEGCGFVLYGPGTGIWGPLNWEMSY